MAITERIQQYVQKLPADLQAEVLEYVEYLLRRAEQLEERDWSDLSLTFAMRGIEDDESPAYTTADLKVVFE